MDEGRVIAFLRCPASSLVDLAVGMANLTWKEDVAVRLCGRQAMTQERAAESAGCSVDAMQRWYRSGIRKLQEAWSGVWWIDKIIS